MPRRVVVFDSEAVSSFDGVRQEQRFRLASASFDHLNAVGEPIADTKTIDTADDLDLWRWVDGCTSTQHRTVAFAHNLSYDLRLTRALEHLPALGWQMRQMAISDYGCWVFLRRGERSLYLVDSLSHLPGSLDRITGALGRRRPRLPDQDADDATWLRRCRADVRVLREAVLQLLRLYLDHDCGDFRTTGAAQSSACFRHRFLPDKTLLVHSDTRALEAERRACWAGRAEVWRHGEVDGPLYEYDLPSAYARVGLDCEVPVRLVGEFFPADLGAVGRLHERYALLLQVDVDTDVPTLPADNGGRIVWPVGRFTTWAWANEVENALSYGARIEVLRCYAYERAPLLRDWAAWILDGIAGRELGSTPLGRLVAKEWSRSLIGRFGLRYPLLDYQGELPRADLVLQPVADLDDGHTYMQLQVGTSLYEQTARIESPSSTPQVMGFVMAECRVRLWECMQAAELVNVVNVDTDGLIVTAAGKERLERSARVTEGYGLRQKGVYRGGVFRGPRNLDLDSDRRVNGVPKRAERLSPGVYRGEVWESLPTSLRRRRPSTLLVHERTFTVADRDPRRLHLPDGLTAALRLSQPAVRVAVAPAA